MASVGNHELVFKPRSERLGIREHTRLPRRSRVPRVGFQRAVTVPFPGFGVAQALLFSLRHAGRF